MAIELDEYVGAKPKFVNEERAREIKKTACNTEAALCFLSEDDCRQCLVYDKCDNPNKMNLENSKEE